MREMNKTNGRARGVAVLVLLASLAGCATFGAAEPAVGGEATVASAMAEADAQRDAGAAAAALKGYAAAAAMDPANKEPWRRIAEVHAQQGRPVDALYAAEEVLRRDPADTGANELFIANALLVAHEAVERLRAGGHGERAEIRLPATAMLARLIEVFGDEAVPDEVRARLASDAIARYRASQRQPEEALPRPVADPLDVLGGD